MTDIEILDELGYHEEVEYLLNNYPEDSMELLKAMFIWIDVPGPWDGDHWSYLSDICEEYRHESKR